MSAVSAVSVPVLQQGVPLEEWHDYVCAKPV